MKQVLVAVFALQVNNVQHNQSDLMTCTPSGPGVTELHSQPLA